MVLIGAAFGHGIHDCPSSAAILGRVVGSINLKFLHGGLGAGVANARATPLLGKECLIVITTIDGVIVEKSAHAAKADQAKTVGITDRARSEENEAGPAPAIDGQVADGGLIHSGSELSRIRVDLGNFRRDDNSGASCRDIQFCRDVSDRAHLNDDALHFEGGKPRRFNTDGVGGRLNLANTKIASFIRCNHFLGVRTEVFHCDFGVGNSRATAVGYHTADSPIRSGLGKRA